MRPPPCPFCGSEDTDAEFVDIGVGMQQVTGAFCIACGASQDDDGQWREGPNSPPKGGVAPKTPKTTAKAGVALDKMPQTTVSRNIDF